MLPDVSAGAWSAFLTGLIVSPHCIGMCGPLLCTLVPVQATRSDRLQTMQLLYHLGRVFSYTAVGALAGAISLSIAGVFDWNLTRFFPWALVALLLLVAVGGEKVLAGPRFLRRKPGASWLARARKLPGQSAALGLGLLTPLLPCAPLYMVLWVALISGSPFFGAQLMLGFSLGTIPLLWFCQTQFLKNRSKWNPATVRLIQRSLAAAAAILIAVRIVWIGGPLEGAACVAM